MSRASKRARMKEAERRGVVVAPERALVFIEAPSEDDITRPVMMPHRADTGARDRARLSVLADVGLLLASSGDYVDLLQQLTVMTVPTMADWCAVHLIDKLGELQRLAVRQADPHKLL